MIERWRRRSGQRFVATADPHEDGGEYLCLGCKRWRPMDFGGAPDIRCNDCVAEPLAMRLRPILFAVAARSPS